MVWGIGICLRAEKGVEGACKEGKGDVVLDYDNYIQGDRVRQHKQFLSANYLDLTRANRYFGIQRTCGVGDYSVAGQGLRR